MFFHGALGPTGKCWLDGRQHQNNRQRNTREDRRGVHDYESASECCSEGARCVTGSIHNCCEQCQSRLPNLSPPEGRYQHGRETRKLSSAPCNLCVSASLCF